MVFGIDNTLLMLYVSLIFLPVITFIFNDALILRKTLIIYFESEKIAKVLRIAPKDNIITIGKKEYIVDKAKSVMIKIGTLIKGFVPLYVIKNDKVLPLEFMDKGIKTQIDPESLKALRENKTLGALLTPKSDATTVFLYIGIGLIMGGLGGYIYGSGLS